MTPVTPTVFRVIEGTVARLRKLFYLALISGVIAGLLLFGVQRLTIFPLIQRAEVYENDAEKSAPPHHHEDEGWQPAEGFERTAFTVLTTVLTAIGFSAVLFGLAGFLLVELNWRKGLLWGLAAFVCVNLAPALGLPPQPPGTLVADLYARQGWWLLAVVSTAIGLCLLFERGKPVAIRALGALFLILPHAIGAPTVSGDSAVPQALIREFSIFSILTTGLFWAVLGTVGGFLYSRFGYGEGA